MDDTLKQLLTLLDKGGPAAVAAIMVVMWWLERKDRIDARTKLENILERVVVAMERTASLLLEIRRGPDGQSK